MDWTEDQARAIQALEGPNNVFLTGGAGTGKSTVISGFIKGQEGVAVLASTGTAAILLQGRTFHSFFGLGIMEGGADSVVERALKHRGIVQRLKRTRTLLIDEISMIGAAELMCAEKIARKARANSAPWGGLRMIAVGDFTQLPPVTRSQAGEAGSERPWCFLSEVWRDSVFDPIVMKEVVRSRDSDWNRILGELRWGEISEVSGEVLRSRVAPVSLDFKGTRLFARRAQVEILNQDRLKMLPGRAREYPTLYMGRAQRIDELKRNAPVPEVLYLKQGALVMFRQNDPEYRFVNGTLGRVTQLRDDEIEVELFSGKTVEVHPATFNMLDAEGEVIASASNFPLNLAWACTIHKAQGATLDRVHADLKGVWEHGQSYVALSRVRSLTDLTLEGLGPRSFLLDPEVLRFYRNLRTPSPSPRQVSTEPTFP
jgi:ATP-dependent exoDNAse (exonuclease V) alpha subunit